MSSIGIVYFIQPALLLKTLCYKIGYSNDTNLSRVVKGYKKGTRYLCIMECINPKKLETDIKIYFKNNFKLHAGDEYFEGNESEMLDNFYKLFKKHIQESNNVNEEKNNEIIEDIKKQKQEIEKILQDTYRIICSDFNILFRSNAYNNEVFMNIYRLYKLDKFGNSNGFKENITINIDKYLILLEKQIKDTKHWQDIRHLFLIRDKIRDAYNPISYYMETYNKLSKIDQNKYAKIICINSPLLSDVDDYKKRINKCTDINRAGSYKNYWN